MAWSQSKESTGNYVSYHYICFSFFSPILGKQHPELVSGVTSSFYKNPGQEWYKRWDFFKTPGRYTTDEPDEYHADILIVVTAHVLKRHIIIINDESHFETISHVTGNAITPGNVKNHVPLLLARINEPSHYQSLVFKENQDKFWIDYCKANECTTEVQVWNENVCRGCSKEFTQLSSHLKASPNCKIKYSEIERNNMRTDEKTNTGDCNESKLHCKGCGNMYLHIIPHLKKILYAIRLFRKRTWRKLLKKRKKKKQTERLKKENKKEKKMNPSLRRISMRMECRSTSEQ